MRPPCTLILPEGASQVREDLRVTTVLRLPPGSLQVIRRRVPGIGTIHGFCASSHASETCAGVAFFVSANCLQQIHDRLVRRRGSPGVKRSKPDRRSVFGSSFVRRRCCR